MTELFDIHCRACGQAEYAIEIVDDAIIFTCEYCGASEKVDA